MVRLIVVVAQWLVVVLHQLLLAVAGVVEAGVRVVAGPELFFFDCVWISFLIQILIDDISYDFLLHEVPFLIGWHLFQLTPFAKHRFIIEILPEIHFILPCA